MRTIAAIATLAFVLVGCGSDQPADEGTEAGSTQTEAAYSEECGSAMEEAASVGDMEDTVEDTDPAIIACATVEAFAAASADHPDALDGTDVMTWLTNRCEFSEDPDVQASDICAEVSG